MECFSGMACASCGSRPEPGSVDGPAMKMTEEGEIIKEVDPSEVSTSATQNEEDKKPERKSLTKRFSEGARSLSQRLFTKSANDQLQEEATASPGPEMKAPAAPNSTSS
mmetsp:Transcript_2769/g.7428  ORF Transcript_2769/g.7428 Transcript_2769/m.7428 type:complete len:109 (-) Transcript_2769:170-496(-)